MACDPKCAACARACIDVTDALARRRRVGLQMDFLIEAAVEACEKNKTQTTKDKLCGAAHRSFIIEVSSVNGKWLAARVNRVDLLAL